MDGLPPNPEAGGRWLNCRIPNGCGPGGCHPSPENDVMPAAFYPVSPWCPL